MVVSIVVGSIVVGSVVVLIVVGSVVVSIVVESIVVGFVVVSIVVGSVVVSILVGSVVVSIVVGSMVVGSVDVCALVVGTVVGLIGMGSAEVGVGVVSTIEVKSADVVGLAVVVISTTAAIVDILPSARSSPTFMTTRDVAMTGLPGRSVPPTAASIRRVSRSAVVMVTGTSKYADTPMLPS